MTTPVRVVHYINQFFAGFGGEEAANRPVEVHRDPIGATRGLVAAFGREASVVATIVAGDNYMSDERGRATAAVRAALRELRLYLGGQGVTESHRVRESSENGLYVA